MNREIKETFFNFKNLSHILMREKEREMRKHFAIYHSKFWHYFCKKLHLFIYLLRGKLGGFYVNPHGLTEGSSLDIPVFEREGSELESSFSKTQ